MALVFFLQLPFFIFSLLIGTFLIKQVTLVDVNFMYDYQTLTQCGLVWAAAKDSLLPHAVYAGADSSGQDIYVARGRLGSDLVAGKFLRTRKVFYLVLAAGGEKTLDSFQMLTNPNGVPIEWVNFTGTFPTTAILVGSLGELNPVYIGRSKHKGDTVIGYLGQPNDKGSTKLFYSWGGSLQSKESFEILVTPHCKIKQIIKFSEVAYSAAAQKMGEQMYNQQVYDRCGLVWVSAVNNFVVANAVSAGNENSHIRLYIARASRGGQLKAGKFIDSYGMYLVHGATEYRHKSYQVLTNPHAVSLNWVPGPSIPSTAIVAGSIDGKSVYIGRFGGENTTRLGYLYPARDGKLRFSFNGKGYTTEEFEVLVAPNCDTTANAREETTSDQLEAYEHASHVAQYMYEKTVHDKCGLVWKSHSGITRVPKGVPAGPFNDHKNIVFVARTLAHEQLIPGRFINSIGMFIALEGKEVDKSKAFEVLTNPDDVPIKWLPRNGTTIPSTAVVGGFIAGKPVYIGRTMRESDTVVGYLYPTKHTQLVYAYRLNFYTTDKYEILVTPDCD